MNAPNPALTDIQAAVRAIPMGRVSSYGVLAARAGWPGRARLVARALSASEDGDLPWHRVLRSDGRIAFPVGTSAFREQSRRLKAEGVKVVAGRVDLKVYASSAQDSLDAALWGPPVRPKRKKKEQA